MKTRIFPFLLSLFFLSACRDQQPPEPGVEGRWRQLIPQHPAWEYEIRDGLLTQSVVDFGATLTSLQFPYAERGDTLYIGGDGSNDPRRWVVRLVGDRVMEVRQLPVGSPGIGWYLILERM